MNKKLLITILASFCLSNISCQAGRVFGYSKQHKKRLEAEKKLTAVEKENAELKEKQAQQDSPTTALLKESGIKIAVGLGTVLALAGGTYAVKRMFSTEEEQPAPSPAQHAFAVHPEFIQDPAPAPAQHEFADLQTGGQARVNAKPITIVVPLPEQEYSDDERHGKHRKYHRH
jgi:hypothetical protein